MPAINLTTYADLTEHLLDFAGGNTGGDLSRDARRAAVNGLGELARSHLWSYYLTRGRVATVAPYSTGTVAFNSTTNILTLTSGTWPSWAAQGMVVLNNVSYDPYARLDDTRLQLSTSSNPGSDIAAGASYTLYRDSFPLPIDCTSIDRAMLVSHMTWLEFEHPGQWLLRQQIYRGPALPRWYTIRGDQDYMGAMAISFFPAPDSAYEVEFMYNRQPRSLRVESYSTGRASVTALQVAVTGTGTAWDSNLHTGSVMRFSPNTTTLPTSNVGSNPAALERVIVSVESATALTLDQPAPTTLSGVAYVISDPADVEPLAMRLALYRACEYQLGIARQRRDLANLEEQWIKELVKARETDSRNFSSQSPRSYRPFPTRLADFPRAPDA